MDAQRELLELAKEMLGYSDLTPEQIEWAARIEALATTLAAREDGPAAAWQERYLDKLSGKWNSWRACSKAYFDQYAHKQYDDYQVRELVPREPAAPPAQGTGE